MIVADTNAAIYLTLGGEFVDAACRWFRADPEWAAPLLWRSEFRNALATQLRRDRLDLAGALRRLREAEQIFADREFAAPSEAVLRLAAASGCSAYDCEFVAVAMELGVRLVTQDAQVLEAFPRVAVRLA